jgi:hypothetical protein
MGLSYALRIGIAVRALGRATTESRAVTGVLSGGWARRVLQIISGARTGKADDDPSRDYAARSDWTKAGGRLNYSSFVFLDVNRDGRYSVGDRPMAGVKVRLRRGSMLASMRTNANGFANFKMSATKRRAVIRQPGWYDFVVSVPEGWTATGGNAVQSVEFHLIPGSVAGLGTDEMLQPVGLAPPRSVGGRLAPEDRIEVAALKGDTVLERAEISGQAEFRCPVPESADAVAVSAAGAERRFPIAGYPIDVGKLDSKRGMVHAGRAIETINFDAVNTRGLRKIPSGYAGLNWFNLNAMARDYTAGSEGYINGNTSGDHVAYTSSGHPAEVWSEKPFDFIGVALAGAWLKAEGEVATIESWRGNELIASDEIALSALCPIHYMPMLADITRIRFSTAHYWQMVVDDLMIAR